MKVIEKAAEEDWGGLSDRPTAAELKRGQPADVQVPIGIKLVGLKDEGEIGPLALTFATYAVDQDGELVVDLHGAVLFDHEDERRDYENAMEHEVEQLLDAGVIEDTYKDDDTGEVVEKTEDEMRAEAETMAQHHEIETSWETADGLWREVKEAMGELEVPKMIADFAVGFYGQPDDDFTGYISDELDIRWLTDDEWTFLEIIVDGLKERSGHSYRIPPEFTLAALQIFERMAKSGWAEDIAKVIPVWSIRDEDNYDVNTNPKKYHALCKRAAWVGENPEKIHPLLKDKLGETDLGKELVAAEKPEAVKQMTIDMKPSLRENPEGITANRLLDYYQALGSDLEGPIALLKSEGHSEDDIWLAADELYAADMIDPPDYRAITASIMTMPDTHMVVGNPCGTRVNPEGKTPREGLAMALQMMDDVELIADEDEEMAAYSPSDEYAVYKPPVAKREEAEEKFEAERAEHPALPEEVVWQIVHDHLEMERANPAAKAKRVPVEQKAEGVAVMFWERKPARTSKTRSMSGDEPMPRDYAVAITEDSDAWPPGTDPKVAMVYHLWGNTIAYLFHNSKMERIISFATAGWDTNLTRDRLNNIAKTGWAHKILEHLSFSTQDRRIHYNLGHGIGGRLPDEVGIGKGHFWLNLDAEPEEEIQRLGGAPRTLEVEGDGVPKSGALDETQAEIDIIENAVYKYRQQTADFTTNAFAIAAKMDKREEYEQLLEKRDKLMWRGNPCPTRRF